MRLEVRVLSILLLAGTLAAQTAPANKGQTPPSKENPQGYSKDVFEEPKVKSTLGEHATYTPPALGSKAPIAIPADLQKVVSEQFGPDCAVSYVRSSIKVNYRIKTEAVWTPFLIVDIDNDGIEDAIIVARCTNPLARHDEFGYSVIDPYMAANGYGDPKITQDFATGDPEHGHMVLIIQGAGAEGWRAAKAKSKVIVLNLPFDNLGVTHVIPKKKKPAVNALLMTEGEGVSSVLFWDGKKYRWRDSGTPE